MSPSNDWQNDVERYLAHVARSSRRPTIVFTHHGPTAPVWSPAVDVFETGDALVVRLDLAGVDPAETEVRAEAGQLVVRGTRRERGADQRTYHTLEIPQGRFERVVSLPSALDTDAARASYRDGFLEVTLPKRRPKQVRISVETERTGEGR